jgi:hypothetical protein
LTKLALLFKLKLDGHTNNNGSNNANRSWISNLYNMEVFQMICQKCDSRDFDGNHCSFCGFVVTRIPTEQEKKETHSLETMHLERNDYSYPLPIHEERWYNKWMANVPIREAV